MKKYRSLASDIQSMIENGKLLPGDKLPSLRELSEKKKVGLNTVIRAYEYLELMGFIMTKSQSGFYVNENYHPGAMMADIEKMPVEVRIQELTEMLIDLTKNKQSIPFGVGFLSPELYPCDTINRITKQVLREEELSYGKYSHPPGEIEYRRKVANYLKQRGTVIDHSEILSTNGTMDGIIVALRAVCEAGDTVVVESPHFFGILQILEILKLKVIEIPCHPIFGIELEHLKHVLANNKISAAVVMPNFNNPVGSLVSDTDKMELIKILDKKNIPIIENDVYSDLAHSGIRPKPLKAYGLSDNIITCSSFSKTVSPSLRIGWIAPGKHYNKVRYILNGSTTGTSLLSQKILSRYLGTKDYLKNLSSIQNQCALLTRKASESVRTYFPEEVKVSTPKGGFVLWLELPRKVNSISLYKKCLSKQIIITPGPMFSPAGHYQNFCRINCGNIWTPKIEKGFSEVGKIVKDMISE